MTRFDRDGLVFGLRQLVATLGAGGERSGISIVGGAALALRYFDRESTVDIDAHLIGDHERVLAAGREIAEANGWPADWLNDQASGFIPNYGRRTAEWESIYDDGRVVIQVASADALLAMKLRANRPGRDDTDIAKLMVICDIRSIDAAADLYEDHYPAEALAERAVRMVARILEVGLPPLPSTPPKPAIA
ncbi:DUF6036 family nucleotidyltransferase [Agromyces aureus]|uniref:DUF6036 domain-containing protein n=1 Tax=Agromyces aureus TaxID=453304 RepID=A0A191WD03_9MICO|nr:DUF6036 family nucleotidyltransferase [Agromyces aureus]ANJ26107.1 hypothetical protein ATC03_04515 [Agromyces aureus]